MKNNMRIILFNIILISMVSCSSKPVTPSSSDIEQSNQTEILMQQANNIIGMPNIVKFQEKRTLKWIYELCDNENMICHAYLFNEMTGTVGQYLGKCIGYGIPYSTQFSNPEKLIDVTKFGIQSGYESNDGVVIQQPEPNGLFKPSGLSATWLIMIDDDGEPYPMYIEPQIIVTPVKIK